MCRTLRSFTMIVLILMEVVFPVFAKSYQTVAVIPFDSSTITDVESNILSDIFENRLAQLGNFDLVERTKINHIMDELHFDLSDFAEASTSTKIGHMLTAQWLVLGTIGQLGKEYFLNIKLVNTETGLIVTGVNAEAKNLNSLKKEMERAAKELSKYILIDYKGSFDLYANALVYNGTLHSAGISIGIVKNIYKQLSLGFWGSEYMRLDDQATCTQGGGKIIFGDPRKLALSVNLGLVLKNPFKGTGVQLSTVSSIGIYYKRVYIEFMPMMAFGIDNAFGVSVGYSL